MENLTIITNNQYRNLMYGYELTKEEQKEFDYLDDIEDSTYFKYKGQIYSLDNFMRIENHPDKEFSSYDGYHSDSYFSGVLIKLSDCGEAVKVARYYS